MKRYIILLITILLASCDNKTRLTRLRERYGPPSNFKVEQVGETKIERLFWSHGEVADEKIFVENFIKQHIKYYPYPDETEIDEITYFEGDKQLKYEDCGFSIRKTLVSNGKELFFYEFKKGDVSYHINLKSTSPLSPEEFRKLSYSKEDPQFQL